MKPILVNVGRAGAASMNITQEVEFVQPEAKVTHHHFTICHNLM